MFVDKRRNVIAHVENEPDGDEAGDAVKIDLQEIANDVPVEKLHDDFSNFSSRFAIYNSDFPLPTSVIPGEARNL
jgi:hypothetical protein